MVGLNVFILHYRLYNTDLAFKHKCSRSAKPDIFKTFFTRFIKLYRQVPPGVCISMRLKPLSL